MPSVFFRIILALYTLLTAVLLPVILLYIFWRGKKDPRYSQHLFERFGWYKASAPSSIWVHAVSLGEMRAAAPMVRALLADGERIVTTHFTPAGRQAAADMFPDALAAGQLVPVYVPIEFDWIFRRFFRAFNPKYGLVLEIEIWPKMIDSARRHRVPLFLCNGHYPEKSYQRDVRQFGIRGQLVRGFAGLLIKSVEDAERFKAFGAPNVAVVGELRFEQVIPPLMTGAAETLRPALLGGSENRAVITIASAVEGEDPHYLSAIQQLQSKYIKRQLPPPLFVYVPRAPERFDAVAALLSAAGLSVLRRSDILDKNLSAQRDTSFDGVDVLLGDSLGEMYFYLALADAVIAGGGFIPSGAHNVIEPLALKKPVFVGPYIWTIEYPALAAIEAGVLTKAETIPALVAQLEKTLDQKANGETNVIATEKFYSEHAGAVQRSRTAISEILAQTGQETAAR